MSESLTISIRTRTPLWTGGADGTSDRLHATGIIGSLRWWYEAIVRGLGGQACDPVEQSCLYNPEQLHDGLCLGCQLFGATGWARRFRLMIVDRTAAGGPDVARQPSGNRFKRGSNQHPSWYFKGGQTGEADIRIIPTTTDFDPVVILGTLSFIVRWGGLAAKPQLGYGWVEIVSAPPLDAGEFVRKVQAMAAAQPGANNGLPSLDKMFFARLQAPDADVTATLNAKYDLRAAFRTAFGGNQTLRHWVCGSVTGNQRQASKISITQAVDGALRVWGWIPEDTPVRSVTRDQVVEEIRRTLGSYGQFDYWREFNSPRDTGSPQADMATYLSELLREGA